MTDDWDPSIPEHKELAHQIELGNGIPEMRPLRLAREALKTVGFQIEHEEDLAERPDPIPWYYPLEGDILKAQTFWDYFTVWRMSWSGKLVTHTAVWVMELLRIAPPGTTAVGESLKVAADALVAGGRTKVSLIVMVHENVVNMLTAIHPNVPCGQPQTQELNLLNYASVIILPRHSFLYTIHLVRGLNVI